VAIAHDNSIATTWNVGKSGAVTTVAKTNTGSNLVLFVGASTYSGSLITVSGITYNGVALTKINSISASLEGNQQDGELWYLDAPSTGANNIVCTFSAEASNQRIAAASYTGKTSSGIDANATAQATTAVNPSPTCNVNVVASDCWLVSYGYARTADPLVGVTGTTVRAVSSDGHCFGDSNGVVGTGNQTLLFKETDDEARTWPAVCSASFSEAGGGGGGGSRPVKMAGYWAGYAGLSGGFAG